MAGKKHRSYLDDFQRDVNGEYQYRGAHYCYAGTMECQTLRRSLWLCCGLGSALVLAAGCLPGATAGAAWYVTLPTMLALAACGDKVKIHYGIEIGNVPTDFEAAERVQQEPGLDQVICSVHNLSIAAGRLANRVDSADFFGGLGIVTIGTMEFNNPLSIASADGGFDMSFS